MRNSAAVATVAQPFPATRPAPLVPTALLAVPALALGCRPGACEAGGVLLTPGHRAVSEQIGEAETVGRMLADRFEHLVAAAVQLLVLFDRLQQRLVDQRAEQVVAGPPAPGR